MTHTKLAYDPGAGAIKAVYRGETLLLPSAVAVDGQHRLHSIAGLKNRKRPLTITTTDGQFYVGAGAHDFGRPVENLDFDRLTGTPEMRALFYATLSRLLPLDKRQPIDIIIGLPIAVQSGDDAPARNESASEADGSEVINGRRMSRAEAAAFYAEMRQKREARRAEAQ